MQLLVAEIAHSRLLKQYITASPAKYGFLSRELERLSGQGAAKLLQVKRFKANWLETYSLRVMTLGREQIERDGEVVSASDWRASCGPRDVYVSTF